MSFLTIKQDIKNFLTKVKCMVIWHNVFNDFHGNNIPLIPTSEKGKNEEVEGELKLVSTHRQ